MYTKDRLIILDADGTTIDAFTAIERTFREHRMTLGDLERFQKRRNLFKYLGGLKEFPTNLKRQLGKRSRSQLIDTLTDVYREEAALYDGLDVLVKALIGQPGLRTGFITRNITREPKKTLKRLFDRHGIDVDELDFFLHVPLKQEKVSQFRKVRESFKINPSRAFACGDEKKDFEAARTTAMHPFMVSYGFEDFSRLVGKIGVPEELVSRNPTELVTRVCDSLDINLA